MLGYPGRPRRSGRVAEGGALLRRYGGECLHRGFESLLLRLSRGNPMVPPWAPSFLWVSGRWLVALRRERGRGSARDRVLDPQRFAARSARGGAATLRYAVT